MKKENFNFNSYYNYISFNKFNLYYLIDYLLYNIDIELNYYKNDYNILIECFNKNRLDNFIYEIFKNYENKIIFDYDKKRNLLYINKYKFSLNNVYSNLKDKYYYNDYIYNSYMNIEKIYLNDIDIYYLKSLIENYFKNLNLKIEIKENDLNFYNDYDIIYYNKIENEKIIKKDLLY